MIIVDSSVWIDYFNGIVSRETDRLDALLSTELLAVGDLILAEVLQGFRSEADAERARAAMDSLTQFPMLGVEMALLSAANFRQLRRSGITVRKTIDVMIASFCIEHDHQLLFADRDFLPFVERLGLRPA
ncbi:PIN domain nuclease [Microlunatus elymi]|uniref:PIN domain nuclease n=1 Tax=Microlunatus elymi TaxID=2596828 RepID=A0A516Q3N1_9ACTN|nr:PIN domain nuclease [Microlunatus elymi]QDP98033.1 PIN domain nuclease [Microlunatus elymi]